MKKFYIPLSDDLITLLPMTKEHVLEMRKLSGDADVWTWYTEDLTSPDALQDWMMKRFEESQRGEKMTYAVQLNETGGIIGSSSYGHIDWEEKGIEIGWTWLGKKYIGSGINKHMKFLMLHHAFETMEIERLELRTDELNTRSRKAMEKIGAKHDGTLRNHRSTQGRKRRNTVVYSIIKSEWPEIKTTIFKEF
ncbi:Protein N-acetyltransferase, RimJ/RimL family [Ekhidna lutea]|uniref:Protein N-acetyltransferase, RimJ/RimL family n=1 Tax=Ekhidna lutea TaxID=447679 RepID=A0A239FGE5_EKHLU|nr:GNAT family N-acetyltransferase [Ekhidna lutea]SNS55134.1 Protein N-acetyltransferase, RimJ/RimL family [Ekhidna lutea]